MPSEAQARITINKLLEVAGWRFLPDATGRRENIVCEQRVSKKVFAPNVDLGADFEHVPGGFVEARSRMNVNVQPEAKFCV